uniref:Glycosyltransferase n=1 Tax=[Ixeris] dentata var. albiflora TaxID=190261 RepID=A9X3L7_9ASTR|nr:UDP-glucosyltransferase [[Ixeris] dentata var. albiflora]
MAEEHNKTNNSSPHVVIFPFPSQGHINPLIQFAKRLSSKGVKPTLITTIYIAKTSPYPNSSIVVEPISDGFDDGGFKSATSAESYIDTFHQVGSKSLANLIRKLVNEGNHVDAIIYDSFVTWALDVAMEYGIDGGCFFTQACAVNNIYYHVYKGVLEIPLQAAAPPTVTILLPELPQLQLWETPSFVHNPGPYPGWAHIVFNQFPNIHNARWVFSNTFFKLEEQVIKWMRLMWPLMVVGPTVPSMYLDKRLEDDDDYGMSLLKPNHIECMGWLNNKPKGSVVYVSFGSYGELGVAQMEEIAWGLNESSVNYLWVVRETEKEKLPKSFLANGLIVEWCRQLEVLAHEAVGCFVTHCGFNSSLETISLGVPVVAIPQWTDQTTNAKCLEDIWGVGIRAKTPVTRTNLVWCIKEIMEGERGAVARKNAIKWKDLAIEAVSPGGSSDKDINEFVSQLSPIKC